MWLLSIYIIWKCALNYIYDLYNFAYKTKFLYNVWALTGSLTYKFEERAIVMFLKNNWFADNFGYSGKKYIYVWNLQFYQ